MLSLFKKKPEKKKTELEALIESTSGPILLIKIRGIDLATLFFDGKNFCLIYTEAFLDSGIAPFNPNDFKKGESPKPGVPYCSKTLWNAFYSRLPSPSRSDFAEIKQDNLNENELLALLGKVGRLSIAKPWRIELVEREAG